MERIRLLRVIFVWLAAGFTLLTASSRADVIRDGSLGNGPLRLEGPDFVIAQRYGQTHGGNLFHSFETFNLGSDQSATFEGSPEIDRILSRVTGPGESLIDGLLRSTIPDADLYLINPHGVVFGPHAQLDIPGSFHVSSANYLRLGESDRFHADLGQESTLTAAAPEAFGFLGAPVGGITVEESQLAVHPGERVTMIGKAVQISGGPSGWISSPGGGIGLVGVASEGEVTLDSSDPASAPDVSSFSSLGDILFTDAAFFNVAAGSGEDAGQIHIRGRDLTVNEGSFLFADDGFGFYYLTNTGQPAGGEAGGLIDIDVKGSASITGPWTILDTQAAQAGSIRIHAGNIRIQDADLKTAVQEKGEGGGIELLATGTISLVDEADLYSGNFTVMDPDSKGGPITITGQQIVLEGNSDIYSSNSGIGQGGAIFLDAAKIEILGFSGIQTSSDGPLALPGGGDITLTATGSILIDKDGIVQTTTKGVGNSGEITIDTGNLSLCNESLVKSYSGDLGLAALMFDVTGSAGNIDVTADEVSVLSGSRIGSQSEQFGNCGSISVVANDSILVSGSGPYLDSQIGTFVFPGEGASGDVFISAPEGSVSVEDGARVMARAAQDARATSGGIEIQAREINVVNAMIGTESSSDGGSGNIHIHDAEQFTAVNGRIGTSYLHGGSDSSKSGDIKIAAQNVEVLADSNVTTLSDSGDAGNITLQDAKDITIDESLIESGTQGDGAAGDIHMSASVIEFNQGAIEAVTNGSGNSGNISIHVDQLIIVNGGDISNSSQILDISAEGNAIGSPGEGGRIDIFATESVELIGADTVGNSSSILNANVDGAGEDRIITIRTPLLVIDQGQIRGNTFGSGRAANVDLTVDRLVMKNGGNIGTETSPGMTLPSGIAFLQSTGDGGDIHILASTSVLLDGTGNVDDTTGIGSGTSGTGVAGDIIVESPYIEINRAGISAMTCSDGDAGAVRLVCDNLHLAEKGSIDSSSIPTEGGSAAIASTIGDGGQLTIQVSEAFTVSDSVISAITYTNGNAGEISITADSLNLTNSAAISSLTGAMGDGREIRIQANDFTMNQDSEISSRSKATSDGYRKADLKNVLPGDAGSISLSIEDTGEVKNSAITAAAEAAGGGDIAIEGARFFSMLESRVETDVTGGEKDGGNVRMAHDQMVLNRSRVIARADQGFGGDITLSAAELITSADTEIDASSNAGLDGTITLTAPDFDLESGLAQLPTDYLDASALLRPSCQARTSTEKEGSFVVVRRQGLPASPEGLLLAFDAERSLGEGQPAMGAIPGETSGALIASAEGMAAFRCGDYAGASQRLEDAVEKCGDDPTCRFDTLRGLAQSRQAMGRYADSISILRSALEIAKSIGDVERIASALGNLGNAHIALRQPDVAEELLQRGIDIAEANGNLLLVASMLNNQGNHYAAQEAFPEALESYSRSASAAAEAGDMMIEAQALANAGRAALDAGRPTQAEKVLQRALAKVQPLPDGNDKAYVLIHLAKSWERLAAASPENLAENLLKACEALQAAMDLARKIKNDRALSYALGNMAALYRREHRTTEALYLTRQAVRAAERAEAPESLYRWHWQEGKLLWDQGRATAAIAAYRRAVEILEETRQETASQYGSAGAHFRRAVAPVYLDLADALLQGAGDLGAGEASVTLLLEARQTVEKLKAAELRDYFRDECVVDLEARTAPLEKIAGSAAIVYPVVFEDRLELLVSLPSGLQRFPVPVAGSMIDKTLRCFHDELLMWATDDYLDTSVQLYDWLVRPYADQLIKEKVKTLVFVPSGSLSTVPLAALHDGKDFIIDRYALAVTPGVSLIDPKPLENETPTILLAGISDALPGFEPLPCVPEELETVQHLYGGTVLLNDAFRTDTFAKELLERRPSIVHIASHAVFTGDAKESFLLAYDDRIDMDELSDIIGTTRFRKDPIELLMLSACETAAGDVRAALGLSGVAIRAGARSAIGSLWPIADRAALILVDAFYSHLKKGSTSKAEALQLAQQQLRKSESFAHPFFWSPFLMINNWL